VLNGLAGGNGYLNGVAQGVFTTTPTGGIFGNGTGFGNSGLDTVLGPGQSNWDMSLAKLIKIRETQTLQFRVEFFNTFNHPQFLPFLQDSNVNDRNGGGLGAINGTSVSPRVIQLALKYLF